MPTRGEHKTVQARIHAYAEAIHLRQGYGGQVGWTFVSRGGSRGKEGGFSNPPSSGEWRTGMSALRC